MSQINVEKMRERIVKEKARLEHDRDQLHASEGMSGEVGDAADSDVNHPADSGTEMFERTKDIALRANVVAMLSQVDDALIRIDAGTYGKCERCAKQISAGRLEAIPYAGFCIDCQDLVENVQ